MTQLYLQKTVILTTSVKGVTESDTLASKKHTDEIDDEASIGATTRWMMKVGLAVRREEAMIRGALVAEK